MTISPGPGTEFKLGMDWKEVKTNPDDVLDMAEKIAREQKIGFIALLKKHYFQI